MIALILSMIISAAPPTLPATFDTAQPTCLGLGSPDADALYLVPRQVCDFRVCRLHLELQAISMRGASPEPTLLAEGDPLQGQLLFTADVRGKIRDALAPYRLPCRSEPATGPLHAGTQRFTLAKVDGDWWARSDNGRSESLRSIGGPKGDPVVVDGHPDFAGMFARTTDLEGHLVVYALPKRKLAAPAYADLLAHPRAVGDDAVCVGFDTDRPAMLVKTGEWLVRVSARGTERLARIGDAGAEAHAADLDLGCSDDALDEPAYDGVAVIVGPSYAETSIDLSVWQPKEKHWNLGTLKVVKTDTGSRPEEVTATLWHPDVPFMVVRVTDPADKAERFVWVDLAAKRVVPKR